MPVVAPTEIVVIATDPIIDVEVTTGSSGPAAERNDATETQAATTGTGSYPITLDHTPITGTVEVWWNGLPQFDWTLVGTTLTIADPEHRAVTGDTFTITYQYT